MSLIRQIVQKDICQKCGCVIDKDTYVVHGKRLCKKCFDKVWGGK